MVVLLHGFPQDRSSWAGVIPPLVAAGYRVLAPDQRGYSPGARPAQRRAYTMDLLAGDVLALADQAGADRFDVVGHDWGAGVAWYLAAHHPDRIRSLTAVSVPHYRAIAHALRHSGQALRSWYIGAFSLPALPEWLLGLRDGWLLREALIRGGLSRRHAERYARRAHALTGPLNWYRAPRSGPLPPVTVPTLYLYGDRDAYVSPVAAEACGRWVTGPYTFHRLRGVNHWIPDDHPRRLADSLLAHLRSL